MSGAPRFRQNLKESSIFGHNAEKQMYLIYLNVLISTRTLYMAHYAL